MKIKVKVAKPKSTILDLIPFGHENAITRKRLAELTGHADRQNRELIMKEKMRGEVILNMEDGKGYFRPILPDEIKLVKKVYNAEAGRNYTSGKVMERLAELIEVHS